MRFLLNGIKTVFKFLFKAIMWVLGLVIGAGAVLLVIWYIISNYNISDIFAVIQHIHLI